MKIIKNIMPSSLNSWKSPYSMKPTRIVVHNTANDASARNEITYMNKSKAQGGIQTSFHYAVDDKEIVQGLEENRNGYHAGDGANGKGNREGIAIEICYSKSGGQRFIDAEKLAVKLIVDILKRYGWGIEKVTKHQDYMNKYCPHRTLDLGWTRFINMIKKEMEVKVEKYILITSVPVYMSSADAKAGKNKVKEYTKGEYFVFNTSNGMINITKTQGKAGAWFNPTDNVIKETPKEEPKVEEPKEEVVEDIVEEVDEIPIIEQEIDKDRERLLYIISVISQWFTKLFSIFKK